MFYYWIMIVLFIVHKLNNNKNLVLNKMYYLTCKKTSVSYCIIESKESIWQIKWFPFSDKRLLKTNTVPVCFHHAFFFFFFFISTYGIWRPAFLHDDSVSLGLKGTECHVNKCSVLSSQWQRRKNSVGTWLVFFYVNHQLFWECNISARRALWERNFPKHLTDTRLCRWCFSECIIIVFFLRVADWRSYQWGMQITLI